MWKKTVAKKIPLDLEKEEVSIEEEVVIETDSDSDGDGVNVLEYELDKERNIPMSLRDFFHGLVEFMEEMLLINPCVNAIKPDGTIKTEKTGMRGCIDGIFDHMDK